MVLSLSFGCCLLRLRLSVSDGKCSPVHLVLPLCTEVGARLRTLPRRVQLLLQGNIYARTSKLYLNCAALLVVLSNKLELSSLGHVQTNFKSMLDADACIPARTPYGYIKASMYRCISPYTHTRHIYCGTLPDMTITCSSQAQGKSV